MRAAVLRRTRRFPPTAPRSSCNSSRPGASPTAPQQHGAARGGHAPKHWRPLASSGAPRAPRLGCTLRRCRKGLHAIGAGRCRAGQPCWWAGWWRAGRPVGGALWSVSEACGSFDCADRARLNRGGHARRPAMKDAGIAWGSCMPRRAAAGPAASPACRSAAAGSSTRVCHSCRLQNRHTFSHSLLK